VVEVDVVMPAEDGKSRSRTDVGEWLVPDVFDVCFVCIDWYDVDVDADVDVE
jgi:hypothetical protein